MVGLRSILGTGVGSYALLAVTESDPLWIRHATLHTLHEVFIVWILAAVFVGVVSWIFQ